MHCYRVSDGQTVPESEAFGPQGIRDGYSIRVPNHLRDGERVGFSLMLCDAASATQQLIDAERTFADSPAGLTAVAQAKRLFDMRQAHKPASERRTWTADMSTNVIRAHLPASSSHVANKDAVLAEYLNDRAATKARLRNAYRS